MTGPLHRPAHRAAGFSVVLGVATALPALLAACARAGDRSAPVAVVDDAGDTVRLAGPPRRIVSLNPVITELVFALGAGDRLVGRTESCDYPAAAARVPSVGGWLPPSVEAVAARSPDLVVLYQGPTTAAPAAQLRALGIAVLAYRTDRLADVSRVARRLGAALGAGRAADSLASAYDSALARLRHTTRLPRSPTVALVTWDQPLIVLGAGSFVSEMVELAGGRNVFDDFTASSLPVSLEALVLRAPRLVATVGTMSARLGARPEWQTVPAVRARRVLALVDPALAHPTPRAPGAIAAIRRQLDSAARAPAAKETTR